MSDMHCVNLAARLVADSLGEAANNDCSTSGSRAFDRPLLLGSTSGSRAFDRPLLLGEERADSLAKLLREDLTDGEKDRARDTLPITNTKSMK